MAIAKPTPTRDVVRRRRKLTEPSSSGLVGRVDVYDLRRARVASRERVVVAERGRDGFISDDPGVYATGQW